MKRIVVSYRLAEPDQDKLEKLAAADGVSLHEVAKELTLKGLRGTKTDFRPAASSSESELKRLRQDLAFALETLLVVTKVFGPEEAKAWVTEKFHP